MDLLPRPTLAYRIVHRVSRTPALRWGFSLLVTLGLWWLVAWAAHLPPFILPTPDRVARRAWVALRTGLLLRHTLYTLVEVLAGLALGLIAAVLLGYLLSRSRTLEQLLSPYIVASQSIPIVAIAPLLIIWFGSGLLSKVLIGALIVFFPMLVNTLVGLHSVPEELRDLMRSLGATSWQTLRYLEIPAALPVVLGGLRISATLSVIGAVVGEFVAADRGLGFLINLARGRYDTPMVFVAVLTLILMALALYGLATALEHRLLAWRRNDNGQPLAGR